MRRLPTLAFLLALAVALAPPASAKPPFKIGCTGSPRAADPGVGVSGNGYLLVSTSRVGDGLPIRGSFDGRQWCWDGRTRAFARKPGWVFARSSYWAPEIRLANGRYVILYSAFKAGRKGRNTGRRCLGIARSTGAIGTSFSGPGRPLFCAPGNRYIDPSLFVEGGRAYVLYKEDRHFNAKGPRRLDRKVIVIRRLLRGDKLGRRHQLLQASQPWEIARPGQSPWPSAEAPTLIRNGGLYYLFYSGNLFNGKRYGVGVARSTKLLGPYKKLPQNPILGSFRNPKRCGLGHQDISFTPRDGLRLYFHAKPTCAAKRRYLSFRTFTFKGGWPSVPVR